MVKRKGPVTTLLIGPQLRCSKINSPDGFRTGAVLKVPVVPTTLSNDGLSVDPHRPIKNGKER